MMMRPITKRSRAVATEMRSHAAPYLRGRRGVAVANIAAIASLSAVSLYQGGVLRHLPDPPLARAQSDAVAASPRAYWLLSTPDGALGVLSYSATLVLALAGGTSRHRHRRWLALAFGAKLLADAAAAGALLAEELRARRQICVWCGVASAAAFIAVPLGLPEAIAAVRT